jgi:hypothetical protein
MPTEIEPARSHQSYNEAVPATVVQEGAVGIEVLLHQRLHDS